ncbi:MAG: hypothetical protein ACIWVG_05260 [Gloeotrichia echinulata HAB0833]
MTNFSKALDKTLETYGISASWLSDKADVSQQMISGFRNGKQCVKSDSLEKMINALPKDAKEYFFSQLTCGNKNLQSLVQSASPKERAELLKLIVELLLETCENTDANSFPTAA